MKINEHNEKVLEKFAEMIISRMEQMKSGTWKKGWVGRTLGGSPMNIEGNSYQGSNVFWLMMDCSMSGYDYPIYCTLKQANKLGARINKGSRSMPVIFWDYSITAPNGQKIKIETYRQMSKSQQDLCQVIPFLKSYNVFNIAQTDLEEKQPDKVKALKSKFGDKPELMDDSGMYTNAALDTLLENQSWVCPIDYQHFSERAFYSPTADKVVVPMKAQFRISSSEEEIYKDGQEYYASLLHEMIHSTGVESRLNRISGKRFGDKLFAKEELVAELGAARIGQVLGFDARILDNNAAYLDSWINNLREEPRYVLSLMQDVDKASRMILDKLSA